LGKSWAKTQNIAVCPVKSVVGIGILIRKLHLYEFVGKIIDILKISLYINKIAQIRSRIIGCVKIGNGYAKKLVILAIIDKIRAFSTKNLPKSGFPVQRLQLNIPGIESRRRKGRFMGLAALLVAHAATT
jgi:hypothetical protein